MKQSWSLPAVLGCLVLSGFASVCRAQPAPIRDTRDIVIPGDFRTNDDAVVLLEGYIGDSCQKLLKPVVSVDLQAQRITITPMTDHVGKSCKEIYLAYRQAVSLGFLPEGKYLVETYDRRVSETLTIHAAP